MTKLKVGVIGVGGIAKTHMPGWDESPYTEVIASSDIVAAVFIYPISVSDLISLTQLTNLSESLIVELGSPCFNFSYQKAVK